MLEKIAALIPIRVGSGEVVLHRVGNAVTLSADGLTLCTAMLLRGYDSRQKVVAYMMMHRGGQLNDFFKAKIKAQVEEASEVTRWEPVGIRTALSTGFPTGEDVDASGNESHTNADEVTSDDALMNDLLNVRELQNKFVNRQGAPYKKKDLEAMARVGSKGKSGGRQYEVRIDEDGNVIEATTDGLGMRCRIL